MPRLKFCGEKGRRCAYSSDGLVLYAFVSVIISWIVLCCAVVAAVYINVHLEDCHSSYVPLILSFALSSLFVQLLVVTVDILIFGITLRGPIMRTGLRDPFMQLFLVLRFFILVFLETGVSILGGLTSWPPPATFEANCEPSNTRNVVAAYTIALFSLVVLKCAFFLFLLNPCNCFEPQPISYVKDENKDGSQPKYDNVVSYKRPLKYLGTKRVEGTCKATSKPLYNAKFAKVMQYTLRNLNRAFCICYHDDHSAFNDIAKNIAILFKSTENDYTISDMVAALLLASEEQKEKFSIYQYSIKQLVIEHMRESGQQLVEYTGGIAHHDYKEQNHNPRQLNLSDLDQFHYSRLKKAIYYFTYSMGSFGWPLYCLLNPCTGCCKLMCRSRKFCMTSACCKVDCANKLCNCHLAALSLLAPSARIVYLSLENHMYMPPYAVLVDRRKESIIITIRGTMSLKDVLTDLSISLEEIEVNDNPFSTMKTQVHLGMHRSAKNILEELLDEERNILEECFTQHPTYSVTIVGHSLGAGVASVLALLFKTDREMLKFGPKHVQCFAYSPPACVFSYPLAVYTQTFVTSIVLNSDLVSSLNWRSLLFLKWSMGKNLDCCIDPKFKVISRGLMTTLQEDNSTEDIDLEDGQARLQIHPAVRRLYEDPLCLDELGPLRQKPPITSFKQAARIVIVINRMKQAASNSNHSNNAAKEGVADVEPVQSPEEEEITTRPINDHNQRGRSMDSLPQEFCDEARQIELVPTFLPGAVYHLETVEESISVFSKCVNIGVTVKSNEDFGIIKLDNTTLPSHFPNQMNAALRLLNVQLGDHSGWTDDPSEIVL